MNKNVTKNNIFLMLRGAPGSGKSTWIRENDLEDFAVSADEWRLYLFGIETDENGKEHIPQRDQNIVWQKVREDMEDRMMNGEPVILDACSLKVRDMNSQIDLCEQYGYTGYVVEFFHDVDEETALERNHEREEYKQVPDFVIERFYEQVNNHRVPDFYEILMPEEAAELFA